MAAGKNLLTRVPNHFVKTITFTGASGLGLVNVDVVVGVVTGRVLLRETVIFCTATLASAGGGSLSLGVTNNAGTLIANTTATDIDANLFWRDPTPELESSGAIMDQVISSNLKILPTTATTESGVLEVTLFWLPLSVDGNLA